MKGTSLPVVAEEDWANGQHVIFLESPFPVERKPYIPARLFDVDQSATIVRLDELVGSQKTVTWHGIKEYLKGYTDDDLPLVIRGADDRLYIQDGHHRLTAAFVRGKKTARVRIAVEPR